MAATLPNVEQWSRVKLRLRAELGEDIFNSWFARATFEEADASTVYLSLPTRFLKAWIIVALRRPPARPVAGRVPERGARRDPRAQRRAAEGHRQAEAPEMPAEARPAPTVTAPPVACRRHRRPRRRGGRRPTDSILAGSPVEPRYTFDTFCEGAANRARLRRRQVGGRGRAGQAGAVQPALHPCRRRPRQDAHPAGDDARRARSPSRAGRCSI